MLNGPIDPLKLPSQGQAQWDVSTHESFYDYYAAESLSPLALQNFRSLRDNLLRVMELVGHASGPYDVADIGCGAGTLSLQWAELGHRVHGIDVSARLVELAIQRAAQAGHRVDFRVASATALPWTDESMDICLAAELVEHVADWKACLQEFARILRPRGVLFLATNNVVWPLQKEFNLPLYSWYPRPLKRYVVRLARTKRPDLANHATYPAVHWFTYFELASSLREIGLECMDRFQVINLAEKSAAMRVLLSFIRAIPPARWLAVWCAPSILLVAVKGSVPKR